MNFSGFAEACASPVIGRVEVLDAKKPLAANFGSASFVTCAFRSRFSNTASMIRSQPARSSFDAVGVMRDRVIPARVSSMRPRWICFSSSLAE